MKYPLSMDGVNHPFINFVGREGGASVAAISLYAPPGVSINDGAEYSTLDLGVIGSAVAGSFDDDGNFDVKAFNENTAATLGGLSSSEKKMASMQMLKNAGMGSGLAERASNIYKKQAGMAINPNTVLQFTNSQIRDFSFQFTMAARNAAESAAINEITETFRKYMYASGGEFILNYPALWKVSYEGVANGVVPKFHDAYLTSMQVVVNPNGNGYHADGAPTEVSVQLSFKESKALKRSDITSL